MLKDWLFYPLACALITAIIWHALGQSNHKNISPQALIEYGYVLEGDDLAKLTASPGTTFQFISTPSKESNYVTLSSNIARKNVVASAGVFAALGPMFEETFAGKNLRITVIARQGEINPLTEFDMGYFTAGVGDSGWIRKPLTTQWQAYSIDFKPKAPLNDLGFDFLGIWPGLSGNRQTMDVQSMKIDVINSPKP